MADYDIITSQNVDAFILANPGYNNTQFTPDDVFVSEGATLSQGPADIEDFLYAVNITLGENSTGTAVLKTGFLDITKPGFTLYITSGVPAPADVLAPATPALSFLEARQDVVVSQGRTNITLTWDALTLSEPFAQPLGPASGSAQTIDLVFDPISVGSDRVLEITGITATATTLDVDLLSDQDVLQVVNGAGFSPGDYVLVDDGTSQRYYEVSSVSGNELTLTTQCNLSGGFTAGTAVTKVTAVVKTIGVDYAIDYSVGLITLVAGQFTPSNEVVCIYTPVLQDLDHYELYRVYGNTPVSPLPGYGEVTREAVLLHPNAVVVDLNILSTALSYDDTLGHNENGTTRTYYLFASDAETVPNVSRAAAAMVETIPTVPQNPTIEVDDARVQLAWDGLSTSSDDNTDGFNVYRCDGPSFIPSQCILVNETLIPAVTPAFDDSVFNTTNRRPPAEVPYPVNGEIYTYKIESEDTDTQWTIGTKNADSETGASNLTASKTP